MKVWDYDKPPKDKLWRLRRIADLMLDEDVTKENVNLLLKHRRDLKLDDNFIQVLKIYQKEFKKRKGR